MARKATFSGGGSGNYERMEEPGWWLFRIESMQTHDREGNELKNTNGKPFWRCIYQVVGGEHDGKQHAERYYLAAGFRMRPLCEAIGYDVEFNQDSGTELDADLFPDHEVVACLAFQNNSKYMEIKSDNESVHDVITVEQARELHEAGTIYVLNLDGGGDFEQDYDEDEAL